MQQNRGETIQMLSDYLRITPSQAAKAYDTRSIPSPTTASFPTWVLISTCNSPRNG